MAEEIYNLKFTGEETDEILESAKNVKEANLTTLNDISGFVCIDKNGNAIGMMSKEQVASVVGGLIGEATVDKTTNGLATAQSQTRRYAINNKYIKITAPSQYYGFVAEMYWYSGGYITHETLTHCGAAESVDTVERSQDIGNVYYRDNVSVVIKPKLLTNTECLLRIPIRTSNIVVELISASDFDISGYTVIS